MAVDIYIIMLFYLALFRYRSWFFWPAVSIGFFAVEVYSLLSFGLAGSALWLALFMTHAAADLFDASSYSSRFLAFSLGVVLYGKSLAILHYIVMRPSMSELFLRSSLFLSHQFLLAVFVGITMYGIFFSIKLFSYAFVEEKIIF